MTDAASDATLRTRRPSTTVRRCCLVALLVAASLLLVGSVGAEESFAELEGEGTPSDPYVIADAEELQAMNEEPDAHYVLGGDVDASGTARWNGGAGFVPVGDRPTFNDRSGVPFAGSFDGRNHTVSGLTIDRPTEHYVGLFGYTEGPVENVRLEDAEVRGGYTSVGALVGSANGDVRGASATGDVTGDESAVGGLIGSVGKQERTVVERAAADVDIVGQRQVGGLVGSLRDARLERAAATGDVEAGRDVGGVVGHVTDGGDARVVYATGDVRGGEDVGGLVGSSTDGFVSDGFAAGSVTGDDVGGGAGEGRIGTHYWNADAVGPFDAAEGTGIAAAEMRGAAAPDGMSALDFDDTWTATDGYPVLEWQVDDVSIALDDAAVGEGERTDVTVALSLVDGSTVTATEVATYDAGGIVRVADGVVRADRRGTTELAATVAGKRDGAVLEVLEPPDIVTADATAAAPAAAAGTPVPVAATYENDGGPGTHTVELVVDGAVVQSRSISLAAGETDSIEFRWVPPGDPGDEYDLRVDDRAVGSVAVREPGTVSLEGATFPDAVGSGTPYEVEATLASNATVPVVESVRYERDGAVVSTDPVVVAPDGSSVALEGETTVEPELTVAHELSVRNDAITGTSEVRDPPSFVVDLEAPDETDAGAPFELTARIENEGALEGETTVELTRGDSTLATETVTLEPGEATAVPFDATANPSGTHEYAVSVGDVEASADVTVADPPGPESDDTPGFGGLLCVFGLLGAILAGRAADGRGRR